MNSFEFLEELSNIDEDLILSAQTVPEQPLCFRRMGVRAAVLAATLFLLSVSVAALSIGVRIWTGKEQVVHFEHDFGGLIPFASKVTTIEYDLLPVSAELPLEWSRELTASWKAFGYDDSYFTGVELRSDDGSRLDFGGIRGLERLLGMDLAAGSDLEHAFVTLSVTDPARCAEQLRQEGSITPDGLIIYLPIEIQSEQVDYCGLNIYLPLTDSFAQHYGSHVVLSSVYLQDLRQHTAGDAVVLVNEPGEGDHMSGFAAWEKDGIGYLLELRTIRDADVDVLELLLTYLGLEETP